MTRSRLIWLSLSLGLLALPPCTAPAHADGALAAGSGARYGWSNDYSNSRDAQARAVNECGRGCRVVVTFNRACAAYAIDQSKGSTVSGWAIRPSRDRAQSVALGECENRGGRSCEILVSACDPS